MNVTEDGIVTELRLVRLNAFSPILTKVLGKFTPVKVDKFVNAPSAIAVTPSGIVAVPEQLYAFMYPVPKPDEPGAGELGIVEEVKVKLPPPEQSTVPPVKAVLEN